MRVAILLAALLSIASVGAYALYIQEGPDGAPAAAGATAETHVPAAAQAVVATATEKAPEAGQHTRRILQRLRHREFAELTRLIESAQRSLEADIRAERDMSELLDAFETADPNMTPLLDEWVASEPASFAPLLARARHRLESASVARGTRWAKDTSAAQVAAMEQQLAHAIADARKALERRPRVGEAWAILISSAMYASAPCHEIGRSGLALLPASFRIRYALAFCLLPRWGGSHAELLALAESAAPHLPRNPGLAVLRGMVEWDKGSLARGDAAIRHLTNAIAEGEHAYFYEFRGRTLLNNRRLEEALADVDRGLELDRESPDLFVLRAHVLNRLGRDAEAIPLIQYVSDVDPTNADLASFRKRMLSAAADDGHELLEKKDSAGAIARLTAAIELTGKGSADVFYYRGRAHLALGSLARAREDFDRAIEDDPTRFDAYRNVDYILLKQQDLPGIVDYWNRYLSLKPQDGRAYFERAGTYRRMGRHDAAMADARRACDLGATDACRVVGGAR